MAGLYGKSKGVKLHGNTSIGNAGDGIRVEGGDPDLRGNIAARNKGHGIVVTGAPPERWFRRYARELAIGIIITVVGGAILAWLGVST